MDTSLILPALLTIMVASVYLFSMFVFKGHTRQNRSQIESLQLHYQNLLMEIHQLEKDWLQGIVSEDLCFHINQKKQEAKAIIRQLQPNSDPETSNIELNETLDQMNQRFSPQINLSAPFVCSSCGGKVFGGDKFCANCGGRLQE